MMKSETDIMGEQGAVVGTHSGGSVSVRAPHRPAPRVRRTDGDASHGDRVTELSAHGPATRASRIRISKGVILAGTPGTTLLSVANYRSKLDFPVAGEPLLSHLLRWLGNSGVRDVLCIACSETGGRGCPSCLKSPAHDGDRPIACSETERRGCPSCLESAAHEGVRLECILDSGPRGTAGALRHLTTSASDDPILVLGGSAWLVDVDLAKIVAFHHDHDAGVTIVGDRSPQRLDALKHIVTARNGSISDIRVAHHSEREDESGCAFRPCGVYLIDPSVLHRLPQGHHLDLNEGLIALLDRNGTPSGSYTIAADVPRLLDRASHLEINRRALCRSAGAGPPPSANGRSTVASMQVGVGTHVSPEARIVGPVSIGRNCRIEAGARILGPASIGDGCRIGRGAHIENAVLWPGVRVGDRGAIRSSLLVRGTSVPRAQSVAVAVVLDVEECGGQIHFLSAITRNGDTLIHSRGRLRRVSRRSIRHRAFLMMKRAMDLALAVSALMVLLPVLAVMAVAIKLDSPGPVLFCQKRCGRGGRLFTMYKLRSMVERAETTHRELLQEESRDGPMFKMTRDPRVTRLGRFLRACSIDEIPQLFNVIAGSMSIVGPRPLAIDEMRSAPGWRDIRLLVKPGITGLWQVSGRSDLSFSQWIRLDIAYVRRLSILQDLRILLLTIPAVLTRRGAI